MPEIGETLRDARMRARIDVTEVETATKIRAKYLRALENEEWQLLPGPTFVKTFLRTYAEYLGLDAKLLVEEYKLRHEGVSDLDLVPITPPGVRTRPARGRSGPQRRPRQQRHRPRISRGVVVGVAVAGVVVLLLVIGLLSDDPTDGGGSTTAPAVTTPTRERTTTATATRASTPPPPTTAALVVRPTAEVYVCIRDARDRLVLSDTLAAGSPSKTYRSRRFEVTVGNSSAVLSVNGKETKVPPSSEPTTYRITPTSARILPPPANAC